MLATKISIVGRSKGLEGFKSEGVRPKYKYLNGIELQNELKNKLVEESEEVKAESTPEKVMMELADVLEAIDGLCKAYGIDKKELMRIKDDKRNERGDFESGFYVEYIEMNEENPISRGITQNKIYDTLILNAY